MISLLYWIPTEAEYAVQPDQQQVQFSYYQRKPLGEAELCRDLQRSGRLSWAAWMNPQNAFYLKKTAEDESVFPRITESSLKTDLPNAAGISRNSTV